MVSVARKIKYGQILNSEKVEQKAFASSKRLRSDDVAWDQAFVKENKKIAMATEKAWFPVNFKQDLQVGISEMYGVFEVDSRADKIGLTQVRQTTLQKPKVSTNETIRENYVRSFSKPKLPDFKNPINIMPITGSITNPKFTHKRTIK
jgi:hypothetical protein